MRRSATFSGSDVGPAIPRALRTVCFKVNGSQRYYVFYVFLNLSAAARSLRFFDLKVEGWAVAAGSMHNNAQPAAYLLLLCF